MIISCDGQENESTIFDPDTNNMGWHGDILIGTLYPSWTEQIDLHANKTERFPLHRLQQQEQLDNMLKPVSRTETIAARLTTGNWCLIVLSFPV